MHDSIRIKNLDELTAATLVDDVLARFRPRLVQELDDWEVQVDGETEDAASHRAACTSGSRLPSAMSS